MKRIMNAFSRYFQEISDHFGRVPDLLRKRKYFVWLLFMAATVFFIFGLARVKMDMTVEGWFKDDDPIIEAFDGFHAEFGSEDNLFIVYKPKDGDVFSAKSLEAVKGIREDLLDYQSRLKEGEDTALKHVTKVKTLINAPLLQARGDVLISKHLVGEQVPVTRSELDGIRRAAESEKKFPLLYYSKDHTHGGILVETDFGAIPLDDESMESDEAHYGKELQMGDLRVKEEHRAAAKRIRFKPTDVSDYVSLMNEVKRILNKPQYANHLEYYPVGYTAIMEYNLKVMEELSLLNVAALVIIILLLWFLFRSLSAVLWPITIVILSTIWTIGLAGWLGMTVTPFVMLTVMLILTIGIADSVHILSGYQFLRSEGKDHAFTLRAVLRSAGLACLLTAITNMIGMLALNITPIVPTQVFAFMSAAGVALALIFTIYLLPLMLDVWPPRPVAVVQARQSRLISRLARYIPDFSGQLKKILTKVLPIAERNRFSIISLFLAIFGVCLYGATTLKVDSNPIEQFPSGWKIRESAKVVDEKMMGAQNLEVFIDLGEEYAFQDPAVIGIMDNLQQEIESKYGRLVIRTSSLVDVIKDSYQKLNGGRTEMYAIPADQRVLSQTLFLFNNANAEDRRKLVSDDYSKSHISIQLRNTGSYEYTKTFRSMRQDINSAVEELRTKYPDTKVTVTGILALMMTGVDYIVWGEIQSFALALVAITIVLLFVFASFKAGVIAILPNLIPSVLAFGLMGLLDIPLDFTTMMLAPVIIGIAVDDTVHFITHYRSLVMIDGDIKKALQQTIMETGQAIMFTSLVLGLGFGIMSIASTQGTSNMGKFGSLAIFAGLLNDLFLLPVIIMIFNLRFQKEQAEQEGAVVLNPSAFEGEI